jgi:hypothetical protein
VQHGLADETDEVDLALRVCGEQGDAVRGQGERGKVRARLDGQRERRVRFEVVDGELG